jgi:hypothetical protein
VASIAALVWDHAKRPWYDASCTDSQLAEALDSSTHVVGSAGTFTLALNQPATLITPNTRRRALTLTLRLRACVEVWQSFNASRFCQTAGRELVFGAHHKWLHS